MKKFLLFLGCSLILVGCTENSRVKRYGGTGHINLPADQKLVTLTWKGDEVWYLTRPMREDEKAETYSFHEESSFGLIEGTYIVKEVKSKPLKLEEETYPWVIN